MNISERVTRALDAGYDVDITVRKKYDGNKGDLSLPAEWSDNLDADLVAAQKRK